MSALDVDSGPRRPRPLSTKRASSPIKAVGLTLLVTLAHLAVWSYLQTGVARGALAAQQESRIVSIPAQEDWVDYGTIFTNGELGAWDYQLFGGFATSAIKSEGKFLLYYQGASGYRIADDSVLWRSIGLATSSDGVNFEKHEQNPILARFPSGNGEEGAASAAAVVGPDQQIALYFGANEAEGPGSLLVNADGRLAVSSDGVEFIDKRPVIAHASPLVWGAGDEIFPIIAFQEGGTWFVYYLPNGIASSRELAVAWGPRRDQLTLTAPVLNGGRPIGAWGPGSHAPIGPNTFALFTNHEATIEVRIGYYAQPDRLSLPVRAYRFGHVDQAIVILDRPANTWFMYYRARSPHRYGVMLAPAGTADTSPPSAPQDIEATLVSSDEIHLEWAPAHDPESGIVLYKVFRDDMEIGAVKGPRFRDTGLHPERAYSYQVSAVNYHGTEGPRGRLAGVTTRADRDPPRIESVSASGSLTQVAVTFDEEVDRASAEDHSNYSLSPELAIVSAALGDGGKVVELRTEPHRPHKTYALRVAGLRDRSAARNAIDGSVELRYTAESAPGLVGAWTFDEGAGAIAFDTANLGNHGTLSYPGRDSAEWTRGVSGQALRFDGIDDLVAIRSRGRLARATRDGHTLAAWARPDDVPDGGSRHRRLYSVITRDRTGLFYDSDQRFMASIRLADGGEQAVYSKPYAPGRWYQVAMVVDAAVKLLHLYVNGREAAGSPVAYSGELADFEAVDYYIATSDPLVERWDLRFKGVIDEVRVFDRALNADQVMDLAGAAEP